MHDPISRKELLSPYVHALVQSLQAAGVQFLRLGALDAGNTFRVKAVPLARLREDKETLLEDQVVMAQVVFGGLPTFADAIQPASGLDASRLVRLVPDVATLSILPYAPRSASLICNLYPVSDAPPVDHANNMQTASPLCCRSLLQRVVQRVQAEYHLTVTVGTEMEFCLLDAQTDQPVEASRFCEAALLNQQSDFLSVLYTNLEQQGIVVHQLHAESAPGQVEVILRHVDGDPVTLVDRLVAAQATVRAVAQAHGMKALFLPKLHADQAGNGNHFHISLQQQPQQQTQTLSHHNDTPDTTASQSSLHPTLQSFLEGILTHLPALLALTLPTQNSFRRVGAGCWTGSTAAWNWDDKEAPLRVLVNPRRSGQNTATTSICDSHRVEYKLMDATANPYLALAAILSAGCDGGLKRNVSLRPAGSTRDQVLPATVSQALDALEADDLLTTLLSPMLVQAYVATRRAEVAHTEGWTLAQEVEDALRRA